jgi:hypothetical protein
VLVDQSVVERADERKVVKVGPAPVPPPPEVVGLGEPAGAAAGEAALPVAVADLPEHPGGRLATESTDANDGAVFVLHHGLDSGVAQKAPDRVRVDHRSALDLAPARVLQQAVQPRVDDDGGPVGLWVNGDHGRAQRYERVGPARRHEHLVLLPG